MRRKDALRLTASRIFFFRRISYPHFKLQKAARDSRMSMPTTSASAANAEAEQPLQRPESSFSTSFLSRETQRNSAIIVDDAGSQQDASATHESIHSGDGITESLLERIPSEDQTARFLPSHSSSVSGATNISPQRAGENQ